MSEGVWSGIEFGWCIVYWLVYRDTFAVSTRVSTRQENLDIAQPYYMIYECFMKFIRP